MGNNVVYPLTYSDDLKVTMINGNNKIGKGVWTLNTLPGEHPIVTQTKGQLTNVLGTCAGCCEGCENGGCYAMRDAKTHHNACIPAWGKNTLILRHDLKAYIAQVKDLVIKNKMEYVRIHSSGEYDSYDHLVAMANLAKELPTVKFYSYTKRFAWVEKYLQENGEFPGNFAVNLSKWKNNMDKYPLLKKSNCNIFAWDDGDDSEIKDWHACPAVDAPKEGQKKGHGNDIKCMQCKRCMTASGKRTKVYNH